MADDLYFKYLSLYIDTSTKQLFSYGVLSLAFLVATMLALTRLGDLESLFGIGDTEKRGWFYKRLQFVGIGIFLAILIGGVSYSLSKFYFYGRTIDIVSRSDSSGFLINSSYEQFFEYMVDRVTIPTLNSELPMSGWWTTNRLALLVHLLAGIVISATLVEWHVRCGMPRKTAITGGLRELEGISEVSKKEEAQPRAEPEDIEHDIYNAFYRRRACPRCGKFFDTKKELEQHSEVCTG